MIQRVLFQMWGPFRQSLIAGHLFYVDQARKRLLSQFDDISSEASKASEEWLKENEHHFDPDRHDPGELEERAYDAGIEFYGLLSDMQRQTRLSVVAGMFHEWDKQLRDWLAREIRHFHYGDTVNARMWSADFCQIIALLESFGWKIRDTHYFHLLDALRLVVNVYKHGEGKSLDELKMHYPDYLDDPFSDENEPFSGAKHLDHSHLAVSDKQIHGFSDAILAFWQDVPENVFASQITDIPKWLESALQKDHAQQKKASMT